MPKIRYMARALHEKSLYTDIFRSTEQFNTASCFDTSEKPDIQATDSAARLIYKTLDLASMLIRKGITTSDLSTSLEESLIAQGADQGGIVRISPENTVWHGMPGKRILHSGEIVTVDIACSVRGWWADVARTFPVGRIDSKRQNLIRSAWMATKELISVIKDGESGDETSRIVSSISRQWDISLVSEGAGHGIGRRLHADPVLTYDGRMHEPMRSGSFYTLEPVFSSGDGQIILSREGLATTVDGEPTAHFELTLMVMQDGCCIPGNPGWIHHSPC